MKEDKVHSNPHNHSLPLRIVIIFPMLFLIRFQTFDLPCSSDSTFDRIEIYLPLQSLALLSRSFYILQCCQVIPARRSIEKFGTPDPKLFWFYNPGYELVPVIQFSDERGEGSGNFKQQWRDVSRRRPEACARLKNGSK